MRIGELASAAGVSVQTLRYYERRGLVRPDARDAKGHRVFGAESVRLVRFIKSARDLGFGLSEVQGILVLHAGSGEGPDPREVALARVRDIEARLLFLNAVRRALWQFAERCLHEPSPRCLLFEELEATERPSSSTGTELP